MQRSAAGAADQPLRHPFQVPCCDSFKFLRSYTSFKLPFYETNPKGRLKSSRFAGTWNSSGAAYRLRPGLGRVTPGPITMALELGADCQECDACAVLAEAAVRPRSQFVRLCYAIRNECRSGRSVIKTINSLKRTKRMYRFKVLSERRHLKISSPN